MIVQTDFDVQPASWLGDEQPGLRHVREQVFILEQRCSEEEEWDALDEKSFHVIARDRDGRAIGTGRLTPQRKIGRIAVLAEWRGRGVGEAIMHVLLAQARASRWPAVELHAQTHAIPFYAKFGFAAYGEEFLDCEIAHRAMRLELDLADQRDRAPLPPKPLARILTADHREQALAAVHDLLADTRNALAIYTRDLDAALFDVPATLDALKRIALSGRHAQIRILVHELGNAVAGSHRLLALAQRLPSAIALRTPLDERDLQYPSAFLINDRGGYLFRALGSRLEAEGSTYDPGRHAQLRAVFDQTWERAAPCAALRPLGF